MECGVGKRHTVSSWELSSAYPICPGQSESDPLSLWAHNSTLNSSSWGPIPWIFLELLWKSHVFSWVAERRSWKSSGDLLAMWPISKEPGSENSCLSEEKSDTERWRRTKFWYCWSSLWMQSSLTSELCSCISQWSPFPSFLPLQAYTIYLSVCLSVYLSAHLSISHLYRYLPLYCSFFAYLFRFLLLNLLELGSVPMSKYDHAILFFFFSKRLLWDLYPPEQFGNCGSSSFSPAHFTELLLPYLYLETWGGCSEFTSSKWNSDFLLKIHSPYVPSFHELVHKLCSWPGKWQWKTHSSCHHRALIGEGETDNTWTHK